MKEFVVTITQDHQIKGEHLLLKAYRNLKPGRYRNELYCLNKRSLNQNAYEHVVFTLSQKGLYDQGYSEIRTMDDAKLFYKKMFLTYNAYNELTGEEYPVTRSTSELSKDETSVFIDQIREHQLEWCGVHIPTPDEWKQNVNRYDLVGLSI